MEREEATNRYYKTADGRGRAEEAKEKIEKLCTDRRLEKTCDLSCYLDKIIADIYIYINVHTVKIKGCNKTQLLFFHYLTFNANHF